MVYALLRLQRRFAGAIKEGVRYSLPMMPPLCVLGAVGFPLYYIIWAYVFPQPYENLPLRLIGMVVVLPFAFTPRWPAHLRAHLPLCWFLAATYALPFFFGYMLFMNGFSPIWAASHVAATFLLVLALADSLALMCAYVLGTALAALAFWISAPELSLPRQALEQIPVYIFALVTGLVFMHKKGQLERERLSGMLDVSRSIAHELRTPLLGIRSGLGGLRRYLPPLIKGYESARAAGLDAPYIRRGHYESLRDVVQRLDAEVDYSNTVIDMLLANAGHSLIEPDDFGRHSISRCVESALARYPFRSGRERALVRYECRDDFDFYGSDLLVVHVLFNLLKNALYHINIAGKGRVEITSVVEDGVTRLYFTDTGPGIAADRLPFIFERYYSSRAAGPGAGIGLAFCKMAMESLGGSIRCRSECGHYTEFALSFTGGEQHA